MKSKLFLFLISFFFVSATPIHAYWSPLHEPEPFEKGFIENGYQSIDDAVCQCENHFNRKIDLPVVLLPVAFTHAFAQCSINKTNPFNDQLDIDYLTDSRILKQNNHFKINIRLYKEGDTDHIRKIDVIRKYTLETGITAVYGTMFSGRVKALVFEKNGWQYLFGIDKGMEDRITPDMLVQVANSIGLSPL